MYPPLMVKCMNVGHFSSADTFTYYQQMTARPYSIPMTVTAMGRNGQLKKAGSRRRVILRKSWISWKTIVMMEQAFASRISKAPMAKAGI